MSFIKQQLSELIPIGSNLASIVAKWLHVSLVSTKPKKLIILLFWSVYMIVGFAIYNSTSDCPHTFLFYIQRQLMKQLLKSN